MQLLFVYSGRSYAYADSELYENFRVSAAFSSVPKTAIKSKVYWKSGVVNDEQNSG